VSIRILSFLEPPAAVPSPKLLCSFEPSFLKKTNFQKKIGDSLYALIGNSLKKPFFSSISGSLSKFQLAFLGEFLKSK